MNNKQDIKEAVMELRELIKEMKKQLDIILILLR
tara:strand:+ start:2618 stop:2719 length:102 start_codon:yes stop_codon:yes gene_type:complete